MKHNLSSILNPHNQIVKEKYKIFILTVYIIYVTYIDGGYDER